MILYLDTSAFVKLYLEEPDSARVRQLIGKSIACASHLITYAEMRSALARAEATGRISPAQLAVARDQFERDWLSVEIINVDASLVRRAGELSERFHLRGFDSVHLAAGERVVEATPQIIGTGFVAFDRALQHAASELGLPTL